jgi:hypothetical protein
VIIHITSSNVRYVADTTVCVGIVLPWAVDPCIRVKDVFLTVDVSVAEEATREDWDDVIPRIY